MRIGVIGHPGYEGLTEILATLVREGPALKRGEGSRRGHPAVIVGVQKQPGANTLELTARLDRVLDTLQTELPKGMTIDRRIFRQADFIDAAIDNLQPEIGGNRMAVERRQFQRITPFEQTQ